MVATSIYCFGPYVAGLWLFLSEQAQHRAGNSVDYGYVAAEHTSYNKGYEIEIYNEVIPATRHERALYDPERKKIMM